MALRNARHERFAQELAKGSSAIKAYVAAGYRHNRSASSRLRHNPRIKKRVAELQGRAARRTGVTVASLTARLLALAARGEASDEAGLMRLARATLMDAAKLNGLLAPNAAQKPTTLEDLLARMDGKPPPAER